MSKREVRVRVVRQQTKPAGSFRRIALKSVTRINNNKKKESCVHCHLPVLDRNSRGFTSEFTAGICFVFLIQFVLKSHPHLCTRSVMCCSVYKKKKNFGKTGVLTKKSILKKKQSFCFSFLQRLYKRLLPAVSVSLLHPLLVQNSPLTFLNQREISAPSGPPAILHHRAEGGGAVCGGVAICWRVRPHQQGAAVYGVFSLLRGRH